MNPKYLIFDGLAFGAEQPAVERSPDGFPTAWRLLRVGRNELTRNGKSHVLTLSAEDIAAMADYAARKGEKIPIDSRHTLFLAARKFGVEESEVRKLLPHGVAALGFAGLQARPDGLWAVDVEFLPLAAEVVAEGMFRYFSPVLRGLEPDGVLRVSSIALDNVPALNQLDVIAASDCVTITEEVTMTKLQDALRKLLSDDALALGAENEEAVADKVLALADELPELRRKAGKADALELAAENAKRDDLIQRALASGKFCNAQRETLEKLDIAVLSDLVEKTPKDAAVPTSPLPEGKKDEADEPAALTDREKEVAKSMNLSDEEFLAAKKSQEKKEE